MTRPSDKVAPAELNEARKYVDWLEENAAERYDTSIRKLGQPDSDIDKKDVQRNYNSLSAARKVQEILTSLAGNGPTKYDYDPDLEFMRIVKEEGWLPSQGRKAAQ